MQSGVSIEKMVRFEELTKRSPIMREIYILDSTLSRKQESLYDEQGGLRKTIVFFPQVVTYFSQLRVAVEGGQQRTYKNCLTVESTTRYWTAEAPPLSFSKAWKQVENGIMSGENTVTFA